MKHVIKLGVNRYLHLDSYRESNVSHHVGQAVCALMVVCIAAVTAGALVGVDIFNPNSQTTQHETR